MIPPVLNDTGDCCCQCPPSGPDGWCHCNDDYNGKGDDIENAITCDLVWTERQPNGRKKYFKVVSGSSQQNMPVVLPTASLTKRGVVQLTNDLSDREDLALTPKAVKGFKEQLDRETADRVAKDTDLQNQINKEKADRANADADLLSKINQEKTDRANADNALSNRITSVESKADSALTKADSALSKANKAVTSVTSNGNATVTVTKADGTSNSFTINNVAHASSADSATNANHATLADNATHATNADTATKATNADHALVADRLASGSEVDTSSILGFPDYSKGVSLSFTKFGQPSSQTMTSNGFVVVSCVAGASGNTSGDSVKATARIEVNDHLILSVTNQGSSGRSASVDAMLCFPVKKGDTVFVSAGATHSVGDSRSGDVSATFFPCL